MATLSELHVDAQLSNVSVRYQNTDYIGLQLMPEVKVAKESDKFVLYGKSNIKTPSSIRANAAEANRARYTILGRDTYSCDEFALKDFVTDRDMQQADSPLDPMIDVTLELTDLLRLQHEVAVAAQMTTAANYEAGHSTTLTGTSQWSDYANSTPLSDIRTGITTIAQVTAKRPNVFWMGWEVWSILQDHPDMLNRTVSVGKDPSMQRVAEIFGVDRVVVGSAIKDVAPTGVIGTPSFVWGKDAGLAYVTPRPGIRVMSYGYTFVSRQFQVSRYAVPSRGKGAIAIEPSWIYDIKLVALDNLSDKDSIAGYVIKAAVA